VNIGDLKQEILKIIKQECVVCICVITFNMLFLCYIICLQTIGSLSGWSTYLTFSKLLIELNTVKHRQIGLVLTALLHLTNDHGLKLIQDIDSGDEEVYIAFPVTTK